MGILCIPAEIITRAFEYFVTSRTLYKRLCSDYKLPSIRTLTRITSKISSLDDLQFLCKIISGLNNRQRNCVVMLDEVYIKSALLYQRGTLFGHAVNYPDMLATTVLSFMIKSLFGGPEFLSRVPPVTKLNSEFQFNQCRPIIDTINSVQNGNVLAIITDGFRVNQKFFFQIRDSC